MKQYQHTKTIRDPSTPCEATISNSEESRHVQKKTEFEMVTKVTRTNPTLPSQIFAVAGGSFDRGLPDPDLSPVYQAGLRKEPGNGP